MSCCAFCHVSVWTLTHYRDQIDENPLTLVKFFEWVDNALGAVPDDVVEKVSLLCSRYEGAHICPSGLLSLMWMEMKKWMQRRQMF